MYYCKNVMDLINSLAKHIHSYYISPSVCVCVCCVCVCDCMLPYEKAR